MLPMTQPKQQQQQILTSNDVDVDEGALTPFLFANTTRAIADLILSQIALRNERRNIKYERNDIQTNRTTNNNNKNTRPRGVLHRRRCIL
jgi:hypothetical protein